MLRFHIHLVFTLLLSLSAFDGAAQQNVFSRSDGNTGDWGSANLPWFYQTSNNNQGDPDNNGTIANNVFIGHNNFTTMTLNGRNYRVRQLIFDGGAFSDRTINGNTLELRHQGTGPSKIENLSTATHTFTNSIQIFDGLSEINPINGNLIFTNSIDNQNNFIDIFGNFSNTVEFNGIISGGGGLAIKENSIVILGGLNTYTGGTFVEAGTLSLTAAGITINGDLTISGGTLEYGNTTDEQINDNSNVAISSGTWEVGARSETINELNATGGTINKGGDVLTINSTASIENTAVNLGAEASSIVFNGSLNLGNATINYGSSINSNVNLLRITSGLTTSTGTTTLLNPTFGFASAYVNLNGSNQIVDISSGANLISEWSFRDGGITKRGAGDLIFKEANLYQGQTILEEGQIIIDRNNAINSNSDLVLAGGTLNLSGESGVDGFGNNLATLDLNANSNIILGSGSHSLNFDNSSGVTWNSGSVLTISGWTGSAGSSGLEGQIFIGNDATGLTASQLEQIEFTNYGFGAILRSNGELVPKIQTSVAFDDFSRVTTPTNALGGTSSTLGGTWSEFENLASCPATNGYIQIDGNNELILQNTDNSCSDGGENYATIDVSGLYATTFQEANGILEWLFNMQQNEGNPSGNNKTAFILGSSESDILNPLANGYALVLGESGSNEPLRLIHFSGGFPLTSTSYSGEIIQSWPAAGIASTHFSVRVTFNPCNEEWTLLVRNDGSSFQDPSSITGTPLVGYDDTHIGEELNYIGVVRNHSSGAGKISKFDNIYIPVNPATAEIYVWDGSEGTDYQNPDNWSPPRSCTKRNDILQVTSSATLTNVPNDTIGKFDVFGNATVTLQDVVGVSPTTTSVLTITGGALDDLYVGPNSTLNFDAGNTVNGNGIEFQLQSGATALIEGTINLQNTPDDDGCPHRLTAVDAGAIVLEGTINANELSGNFFGASGSPGSAIFNSGSTYYCGSGDSPFGSSGNTQVVFNDGSTYIHDSNSFFRTAGLTYGHFHYTHNADVTLNFGGGIWSVQDLRILDSDLTITGGVNGLEFPIEVRGDLEVVTNSAFNYLPVNSVNESILSFTGSTPATIFGGGNITFNSNAIFVVDKSTSGLGLTIGKSLEFFNDVRILDGEVQGSSSSTMTLSGNSSELLVNGDIVGTGVGPGQDLSLIVNATPVTISGSSATTCRFFGIDVLTGNTLIIDRESVESRFDQFNIGINSILQIDATGQAISAISDAPIYAANSQLIYNSGGVTQRGAEWSNISGAGYPNTVTIQNGTEVQLTNDITNDFGIAGDLNIGSAGNGAGTLTMTNVANFLKVEGDVHIGDGSDAGSLTLSSNSGGDLRLRGDWNNTATGTFDPNGRAVFFNGSAQQRINTDGSTVEVFDKIILDNPHSGPGAALLLDGSFDELEIRSTVFGNALEIFDGDIDLNGKDVFLGRNGNATGLLLGSEPIQISSPPGVPANFNFEGNGNKVISASSGGSLLFNNEVTVTIASGVDFGANTTTINATLEILAGGFANGNAPTYGTEGVLVYNTGGNYDRRVEWDGTDGNPGYPNDVFIRTGTTVFAATIAGFENKPMNLDRDLTIEDGASLFLDGGGSNLNLPLVIGRNLQLDGSLSGTSTGGDIHIAGDWNQSATGSYFPNTNEVLFNGASGQQSFTAIGGVTFDNAEIDNPDGLQLNNDLVLAVNFEFNDGIVSPANNERVIFLDGSTVSGASNNSHVDGWVEKRGDDDFAFPTGAFYDDPDGTPQNYFQEIRISGLDNPTTFEARYFAEAHPNAGPYYDGNAGANGELEEISNCDYWSLNLISGTESARVTITYGNTPCNDIAPGGNVYLDIAKWDGFSWEYPLAIGSDPNTVGEVSTIGEVSTFSDFTLASNRPDFNILPITLLSFRAEAVDGLVRTQWVTASEINNDFFTVERSKDGQNWETVGTVDGAGDSNQELSYAFVDDAPYYGISYYRLRQTDFDGTSTVGDPRAVEIRQGNDFGLDRVYRGQEGLNLVYRSNAPYLVVEIYDMLGKRVHGELLENYGNGFSTIYPDLARGAYVLRLSHGSEMDSEKFVY